MSSATVHADSCLPPDNAESRPGTMQHSINIPNNTKAARLTQQIDAIDVARETGCQLHMEMEDDLHGDNDELSSIRALHLEIWKRHHKTAFRQIWEEVLRGHLEDALQQALSTYKKDLVDMLGQLTIEDTNRYDPVVYEGTGLLEPTVTRRKTPNAMRASRRSSLSSSSLDEQPYCEGSWPRENSGDRAAPKDDFAKDGRMFRKDSHQLNRTAPPQTPASQS